MSLTSAIEISDMIRLVNKALQCLGGFNLDLRQAYDWLFHLLCLRCRLIVLEGALEKLPPQESVTPGLNDIQGQICFLQDNAHYILDDFNYVLRLTDGLSFTIRDI